jgi:regulation of enolase protein 1 (concanavalin A-like superfamily)
MIDGLPGPLHESGQGQWDYHDGVLTGTAAGNTDLFVDPAGEPATLNAARLLMDIPDTGDFQLQARVEVGFAASFDAGVLLLWSDEHTWAKLCFEYSPQSVPMVVSVVTRTVSDDANAFAVAGPVAWLRVSRRHGAYAYHASTDGQTWQFIRHFRLDGAPMRVGFEVQSPTGAGCSATFSEVSYREETLTELRDGS